MKTCDELKTSNRPTSGFRLVQVCKKLAGELNNLRQELLDNFRQEFRNLDPRHLRQAVVEAEALAWQTAYPHLLLPALAEEKVRAAQTWQQHQQALWRPAPSYAQAA